MKKLLMLITAIAMMTFGMASVAPAANADEPVTYELHLDISDADAAGSTYDYVNKSIFKSTTNDQGQIMLAPVNHPTAHWKKQFAVKCPNFNTYPSDAQLNKLKSTTWVMKKAQLQQFKKAAMTDKVVKRLPDGKYKVGAICFEVESGPIPDTGLDVNGQPHGWSHPIDTSHGAMLFELPIMKVGGHAQKVPVRRGQANNKGVYSIGDCGNKKPGVVEFDESQVEYGDFDSYWWKAVGDVIARVHVGGTATISQGNCKMTLTYDFLAQGSASYSLLVKGKTQVDAEGEIVKVANRQEAHVDAAAAAIASVKADLSAEFTGCDTPPATYESPTVDVTPMACVNPGQTRDVTVTVSNPNNIADTARLTYRGQTSDKAITANGQVTFTFANQAAGTYNGSALLVTAGKSQSFTVTVAECMLQPGSIVEVTDVNDVRYGQTYNWRIRGIVPNGQTATLRVSARIGTVRESDKTISLGAGAFDITVVYTAPTEGSSDTLTAGLFGSDGVKDDEKSDTFQLLPNPVDPPRPAGNIGGPQST
jgi:hypothetical protein